MSVEKALVAQARPYLLAARAEAILEKEVTKGSCPDVFTHPVALEPPFRPISYLPELLQGQDATAPIPEDTPLASEIVRSQLWLSPKQGFSWLNSELFLKQLTTLSHRVAFEIIGNSLKIQMDFLSHQDDLPIIEAAFKGQFEHCELAPTMETPFETLAWIPMCSWIPNAAFAGSRV